MADRKPLIVLAVLALVAIAVFVFGAVGAGRGATAGAWPDWASPTSGGADQLGAADLTVSSSCAVNGAAITFVGACVVDVVPVTGGFGWERVVRRAILTAGPQSVGVTVTLAGKALHTTLDPGDNVRLTYTREGGRFALACLAVSGCTVILAKDA